MTGPAEILAAQQLAAIILTPTELEAVTGYVQAGKQLAELHRQGFHRARRNAVGAVVLERSHFEAVCRGQGLPLQAPPPGPKLHIPQPRLRAVLA